MTCRLDLVVAPAVAIAAAVAVSGGVSVVIASVPAVSSPAELEASPVLAHSPGDGMGVLDGHLHRHLVALFPRHLLALLHRNLDGRLLGNLLTALLGDLKENRGCSMSDG